VKPVATEFSELLRRIAMARHGRTACAGLHGEDWLAWLTEHDPKGFDWRRDARGAAHRALCATGRRPTCSARRFEASSRGDGMGRAPDPKPARASAPDAGERAARRRQPARAASSPPQATRRVCGPAGMTLFEFQWPWFALLLPLPLLLPLLWRERPPAEPARPARNSWRASASPCCIRIDELRAAYQARGPRRQLAGWLHRCCCSCSGPG
jgi:hypothetical protein